MDEDEEKIAVAATFGISAVFKSPHKSSSAKTKLLQASKAVTAKAAVGPSNQNVDKERLTVDISALKQQYSKLRQRQKQAHIIFTCKSLSMILYVQHNLGFDWLGKLLSDWPCGFLLLILVVRIKDEWFWLANYSNL